MAEGDIGAYIDGLEFEASTATGPKIVHVVDDVFAIAYTGLGNTGWIATVKINSEGVIPAAIEDSLEFESLGANDLDFIKIAAGVFAVVYRDESNDGDIKTVNINDEGTISLVGGGSWEFEAGACYTPCWRKIADNVFAIAYRNESVYGRVVTVSISDAGAITNSLQGELNFDTTRCLVPHIIHVTGEIYVIAYQGVDDDGWIVAVNITTEGVITDPAAAAFEFDGADIVGARVIRVDDVVCAIAYRNAAADGKLVTVSVSAAGVIAAIDIVGQVFESGSCGDLCIIPVSGTFFAIAYKDDLSNGKLKTWSISDAGVISATQQDYWEFDATYTAKPLLLHVSGNVYVIAYTTGVVGGKVISFDIETVIASAGIKHLMMTGVG